MTLDEVAAAIADKIEYEEGVIQAAEFERGQRGVPKDRKVNRGRDIKRSQSKIMAFKEVLQLVLDDLRLEATPDVDSYMAARLPTM